MKTESILVVEDDRSILTGLLDLLEGEGYQVFTASDGKEAIRLYKQEKVNLILLDIMIPEKSGYDVCREIRQTDPVIPILMLTAKGQEVDKVVGLELGADDYIVKPFGVQELLARIRAALRRVDVKPKKRDDHPIDFGEVHIDPKTFTGNRAGQPFQVTLREIQLLQLFKKHDGEVVDRYTLLDEIWGVRYEGTTRTLDQHVARLRQKIEANPASPKYLTTVHGVGYRFCSNPE